MYIVHILCIYCALLCRPRSLKHYSQKQKDFLTAAISHLSSLPRPENNPRLHKQTDHGLSCEAEPCSHFDDGRH